MRALLIDPFKRVITEIGEFRGGLTAIYQAIGCDTFDGVPLGHGDVAYVDGDGLLKPPSQRAYFAFPRNLPLTGKALVVGVTSEGDATDTSLSVGYLTALVRWVDAEEVRQANADGLFDAAFIMASADGWVTTRIPSDIDFGPSEEK